VGLTCAACHTAKISIAGKPAIVEGGQAYADFFEFLREAVVEFDATINNGARFDRFAKKVLKKDNPSGAELDALRGKMKAKYADLKTRVDQNAPPAPYGYGRVDAFGHILNQVMARGLGKPENAKPPQASKFPAPVSYPFLWDTHQHDVVQWNGSAPNTSLFEFGPRTRNIGEVLGVFGTLDVEVKSLIPFVPFSGKTATFRSSANIRNLDRLERLITTLWSPVWPKDCFPLANDATLTRGRAVYDATCLSCHARINRRDPARRVEAVLKVLPEIRTDPTMALNVRDRTAFTGPLEGTPNLNPLKLGQKFGVKESALDLILTGVTGVLVQSGVFQDIEAFTQAGGRLRDLPDFKKALRAVQTPSYKARPLNGIWATAPYLHNGSVPTLRDLLRPESERPAVFFIGNLEFDPTNVGIATGNAPGAYRYDTSPQGNWRNGHPFGTTLSQQQKDDLIEYLKTL
jgi:mono/diheme cytochrome c family protein